MIINRRLTEEIELRKSQSQLTLLYLTAKLQEKSIIQVSYIRTHTHLLTHKHTFLIYEPHLSIKQTDRHKHTNRHKQTLFFLYIFLFYLNFHLIRN